jgi:hypothetical protein
MSQFDSYSCHAASSGRGRSKAKYTELLRIVARAVARGSDVTISRIVDGVAKALTDLTVLGPLGIGISKPTEY